MILSLQYHRQPISNTAGYIVHFKYRRIYTSRSGKARTSRSAYNYFQQKKKASCKLVQNERKFDLLTHNRGQGLSLRKKLTIHECLSRQLWNDTPHDPKFKNKFFDLFPTVPWNRQVKGQSQNDIECAKKLMWRNNISPNTKYALCELLSETNLEIENLTFWPLTEVNGQVSKKNLPFLNAWVLSYEMIPHTTPDSKINFLTSVRLTPGTLRSRVKFPKMISNVLRKKQSPNIKCALIATVPSHCCLVSTASLYERMRLMFQALY
jgi:hypothetical protein